jgi:chromosome segregation ATPase
MARGKYAVAAATRRYEASIDHIDRLTSEVVDAKERARRYESDARRLPGVEKELRRVRELASRTTSDALEAERKRVQELQEALRTARAERDLIRRNLTRLSTNIVDRMKALGMTGIEAIEELLEGTDNSAYIDTLPKGQSQRLGKEGTLAVQRARGERK